MYSILNTVIKNGVVNKATVLTINELYPTIDTEEASFYTTEDSLAGVEELKENIVAYLKDKENNYINIGINHLLEIDKVVRQLHADRTLNRDLIEDIKDNKKLMMFDREKSAFRSLKHLSLLEVLIDNKDEVEDLFDTRDKVLVLSTLEPVSEEDRPEILRVLGYIGITDFFSFLRTPNLASGRTGEMAIRLATKVINGNKLGSKDNEMLRLLHNHSVIVKDLCKVCTYMLTDSKD